MHFQTKAKLFLLISFGIIAISQFLLHPTTFHPSSLLSMNIGVGATGPEITPSPTIGVGSTAPTFTPTPTFTLTPTNTPTETPTLTPTLTPTNTPTMTPTPIPFEQIIDNNQSGFTKTGLWKTSSVGTGYLGSNYLHDNGVNSLRTARWTFTSLPQGNYRVYVRYVSSADRATNALYVVNHAADMELISVNQQVNGGQWFSLGTYPFTGYGYVELRNQGANGKVVADSVRFEQVF